MRKLENRATMCFFVGYKYNGRGYRVWVPKRRVVAESRDVVFFERLAVAHSHQPTALPVDEGESVTRPVLDHSIIATTPPDVANAPTLSPTVRGNAHDLARGHAPACIGANTSSAHHHTPTRARDEQASCTYCASSGRARRHRRG